MNPINRLKINSEKTMGTLINIYIYFFFGRTNKHIKHNKNISPLRHYNHLVDIIEPTINRKNQHKISNSGSLISVTKTWLIYSD